MKKNKEQKKNPFDSKAYKKYMVRLRLDKDRELIDFLDGKIKELKEQRIKNGGGYNVGISDVIKNILREQIEQERQAENL